MAAWFKSGYSSWFSIYFNDVSKLIDGYNLLQWAPKFL